MTALDAALEPVISIRDARFVYTDGTIALDGVSLEIPSGQVVGLAGRNGSGKSTLARLLNGLLRPTAGQVMVGGRDTARTPVRELAAVVGYVFQDPGHQLFASTVRDELAFGPRNLGLLAGEVGRRVEQEAARLGLEGWLDVHPYRLSRPARRLVAIASVLTMHPAVLVLDEPTTGLDNPTGLRVRGLVRELGDRGTIVVVIAHDLALLGDVAERLLVLDAGRVIADGLPREVFADPARLVAAGLEAPQVTRLSLRLGRPAGSVPWPALTPDELIAALRSPRETRETRP